MRPLSDLLPPVPAPVHYSWSSSLLLLSIYSWSSFCSCFLESTDGVSLHKRPRTDRRWIFGFDNFFRPELSPTKKPLPSYISLSKKNHYMPPLHPVWSSVSVSTLPAQWRWWWPVTQCIGVDFPTEMMIDVTVLGNVVSPISDATCVQHCHHPFLISLLHTFAAFVTTVGPAVWRQKSMHIIIYPYWSRDLPHSPRPTRHTYQCTHVLNNNRMMI